ncbi:MAG: hypothetical protein KAS66_15945 [Candidatus Omnitrophica bacterium]|nr:hypothetical protein [Candidatus Omnitrophota bacterium]
MDYKQEIVEVKTVITTDKGQSSHKHGCLFRRKTKVELSNGKTITIHKNSVIRVRNQGQMQDVCIDDLDEDNVVLNDKQKITIKLKVETPKLRRFIPDFVKRPLNKISIVPYFICNCSINDIPKTVMIFSKEKFEEKEEKREAYKKKVADSLSDGKYAEIPPFCPYHDKCISDFPEKAFVSSDGRELSEFDMNFEVIKKLV